MNIKDIKTKIKELEEAKQHVQYLLDHENALVDMHGLAYWAKVVEDLRNDIKMGL